MRHCLAYNFQASNYAFVKNMTNKRYDCAFGELIGKHFWRNGIDNNVHPLILISFQAWFTTGHCGLVMNLWKGVKTCFLYYSISKLEETTNEFKWNYEVSIKWKKRKQLRKIYVYSKHFPVGTSHDQKWVLASAIAYACYWGGFFGGWKILREYGWKWEPYQPYFDKE